MWPQNAGVSLELTRAESYHAYSPPLQPGSQFASRYWAQYAAVAHPHLGTSAALARERTQKRVTLLRTLPDYFPTPTQPLPVPPVYTVEQVHTALSLVAPLWRWALLPPRVHPLAPELDNPAPCGWIPPPTLTFEAIPMVRLSHTNLHDSMVFRWAQSFSVQAHVAALPRLAVLFRADRGEWCLFIADRDSRRVALLDPSGARHPPLLAALTG